MPPGLICSSRDYSRSNLEDDLAAIHPVKKPPLEGQDYRAYGKCGPEVDPDRIGDRRLEDMRDPVGGHRVHANYQEREGPARPAPDLDNVAEAGEEGEAETATEEGPGGGPDSLDDWVDAEEVDCERCGDEGGSEFVIAA